MAGQQTYAPDWIDVQNICTELGHEFGLRVQLVTEVKGDDVEFVARAYKVGGAFDGVLTFQALSRQRLKSVKDFPVVAFNLLFDIFQQADGGGATAARRGPSFGWRGRVNTPRRRK